MSHLDISGSRDDHHHAHIDRGTVRRRGAEDGKEDIQEGDSGGRLEGGVDVVEDDDGAGLRAAHDADLRSVDKREKGGSEGEKGGMRGMGGRGCKEGGQSLTRSFHQRVAGLTFESSSTSKKSSTCKSTG